MTKKLWKKGQSGNLKGRPKGTKNLNTRVKDALECYATSKKNITEHEKVLILIMNEIYNALNKK